MKNKLMINLFFILLVLPLCSAAHYIVGIVENAKDGTLANGQTVLLWNPSVGIQDNLTDIVGPTGNSGTDNIYMIDCEMLSSGCNISSILTLMVTNDGDNYLSRQMNVTVGGFGYDLVNNITLHSPPNVSEVFFDDFLESPQNEIDLIPADVREIICNSTAFSYDGEYSITNASAKLFDNVNSLYDSLDDNNSHYTNYSCDIDYSYGNSDEVKISCKFNLWYYANSENWNCTIETMDNLSTYGRGGDLSFVNPLLALGLDSIATFNLNIGQITDEEQLNVTNYGNVKINLSLSGYAATENDGLSMNCTEGDKNISINYTKFNLTASNPGAITLTDFQNEYVNLTSYPKVKDFNLNYRQNENANEAVDSTYWRIYVPSTVSGNCQGNIIFGAVQAPGD